MPFESEPKLALEGFDIIFVVLSEITGFQIKESIWSFMKQMGTFGSKKRDVLNF